MTKAEMAKKLSKLADERAENIKGLGKDDKDKLEKINSDFHVACQKAKDEQAGKIAAPAPKAESKPAEKTDSKPSGRSGR